MPLQLPYDLAALQLALAGAVAVLSYVVYRLRITLRTLRAEMDVHFVDLFRQMQIMPLLNAKVPLDGHPLPLRGWAISPDAMLIIVERILAERPQTVVECGSGSSTVYIARALQMNGSGHLYSFEDNRDHARKTRRLLTQHGLAGWARVLDAPLGPRRIHGKARLWYDVSGLPRDLRIDLLVIDGPTQELDRMMRYPAGPMLFPSLSPEGIAFLDDADRPDERRAVELWTREFEGAQVEEHPCEKGCISFRLRADR
jgi:Methyltransferase domain